MPQPVKVAIITGASSGIGYEVALLAARRGYRVALTARRESNLRQLAARIESAGGTALVVPGDITSLDDQRRLVDQTVREFGRIDVLVNNAGAPLPAPFSDSPPEELRRQWDTNVTALATLTRLALPYLKQAHGTVVNIGSMISRFPVPGMGNYAPTKIAVAGLNDSLRRELAPQGVKVCLVEPGPVATEFTLRSGGSTRTPSSRRNISDRIGLTVSAQHAAADIVSLFDHPRRRLVIPGWLSPVLVVTGWLTRVAAPLVDAVFAVTGKRR